MKRIIFLLALLITAVAQPMQAQKVKEAKETDTNLIKAALKGWHVRLGAGFNIGGTSPMPLPVEIREINSYKPGLCIQLEGAAQRKFGHHWGTMVGVRLENKGMTTDARVKNYHLVAYNTDGSGKIEGATSKPRSTITTSPSPCWPPMPSTIVGKCRQALTFRTSSMARSPVRLIARATRM